MKFVYVVSILMKSSKAAGLHLAEETGKGVRERELLMDPISNIELTFFFPHGCHILTYCTQSVNPFFSLTPAAERQTDRD